MIVYAHKILKKEKITIYFKDDLAIQQIIQK